MPPDDRRDSRLPARRPGTQHDRHRGSKSLREVVRRALVGHWRSRSRLCLAPRRFRCGSACVRASRSHSRFVHGLSGSLDRRCAGPGHCQRTAKLYPSARNADVSREPWFSKALATKDGADFIANDVSTLSQLDGSPVATCSTAFRRWPNERQGDWSFRNLSSTGRSSPRLLSMAFARPRMSVPGPAVSFWTLLHRVLASSDRKGLFERCPIETG